MAWFGCSLEVMISIYISYNIMHIKYLRFYISVFLYLWVKCWVLWRIYWVRVWGPSGWMSAQFLWREWTLYWWHRQLHLCLHGKKIHSVVKFICQINKNNQEHFAHVSVHIFCKYKLVCQSLAVIIFNGFKTNYSQILLWNVNLMYMQSSLKCHSYLVI